MNGATLNGSSLNGPSGASPFIQGGATATATVTAVLCTGTKVQHGFASGDASVSVSLLPEHHIAGASVGYVSVTASIESTIIFSGAAQGTVSVSGMAFVMKAIYGFAGGDVVSEGYAIPGALGEAAGSVSSSGDVAGTTIIAGRSSGSLSVSSGGAAGDVLRSTTVIGHLSADLVTAEASIRLNGNSWYSHDGYSLGVISCTGLIEQEKTNVSVQLGIFDYAVSSGNASANVRHSGRAQGNIAANGQAEANRVFHAAASATINVTGSAFSSKVLKGSAAGVVAASSLLAKAKLTLVASASGASNSSGSASPQRLIQVGAGDVYGEISAGALLCNGVARKTGAATGSITIYGTALAYSNTEVRAPIERLMKVDAEYRGMRVMREERTMVAT